MQHATQAGRFRVRFTAVLAALYIAFVLAVTLYPTAVDKGLDPYLEKVLNQLHAHGVPYFVNYNFVEFTANIAFFVPVGFLVSLLLSFRVSWAAAVLGGLLSSAIELAQGAFLPGRVSSVYDVAANTSGAVIGTIVAILVRMLIHHRDALVVHDVSAGRRAEDGLPARR